MRLEKIKSLRVDTPQGVSGVIHKESRFSFNCLSLEASAQAAVGLPYRAESYSSGALFSVFAMNRPEGYLLDSLRNRFGKISKLDDMALLKITGRNQIGRLSYIDQSDDLCVRQHSIGLDDLLRSSASEALFDYLVDTYYDSGISGFQPKVMVPGSDGRDIAERATACTPDLIVKFSGIEYPNLTENEFLCMSVAKKCGFSVPDFWLSDDGMLFIMKRFDITSNGERLGMEDICALINHSADEKYNGSYEGIARVIAGVCDKTSYNNLHKLFEYIALSVLLRNGDAHLKNFSVLYSNPSSMVYISPLYDVVTTWIYSSVNQRTGANIVDRTLALKLNKTKNYPDFKTLCEFGKKFCFVDRPDQVIELIEEAKTCVFNDHKSRMNDDFMAKIKKAWRVFEKQAL